MAVEAASKPPRTLLCGDAVELGQDGRALLVGGRCADCDARAFPKPPVCTNCMGENIVAQELPRAGTLYAFSVVHIAPKKWNLPMKIGYVDLSNDVRVFTHLDGSDFAIGDTVEVGIGTIGQDENGVLESFVFKRVPK